MASAQFDSTISALANGPENLSPEQALANIESWQSYLGEHQTAGTEAVLTGLGQLKKHLSAGAPDPAALEELLQKLSTDTLAVASAGNTSNSSKIMEIGEALAG